jgi:hypothetical protein
MNKYIIPVIVVLILLILYFNCSSSTATASDDTQIVIINYDIHRYDKVTQKSINEIFYHLVLLKELLDSGSEITKSTLVPSIINTLSSVSKDIEPILNIEKELTANVKGLNFKIKRDGVGNVCFGSPEYFLCLNPTKKEIFPYVNDKLIVYHIMSTRVANTKFRDDDVEKIVRKIIGNVIPCAETIDFTSPEFHSILLTKLFNSKLMMVVLFMSQSSIIDSLTMNDDGSFYTSNATTTFLQAFVPYELMNQISYKQMKHALYNLCFAKYTLKGFSAVESNKTKLDERKALIDSTITKSLCNDVIVTTPAVPVPAPTPTSTTVIA